MLSGRAVLSVESAMFSVQLAMFSVDSLKRTPSNGSRAHRANSSKQSLFVMYKQKSTTARIKQNKIRSNRLDAVRAHTGELCRLH